MNKDNDNDIYKGKSNDSDKDSGDFRSQEKSLCGGGYMKSLSSRINSQSFEDTQVGYLHKLRVKKPMINQPPRPTLSPN